jgi:hypothetical protein
MGLSDFHTGPLPGYAFPLALAFRATPLDLPGSSADLSTRAVPNHPGRPSECICLLLPRWYCLGFILLGGLATFSLLTRPNRVYLRYGSRVRLPSPAGSITGTHARFGYMSNRQLHGEFLSIHKISQAYPGVPSVSKYMIRRRRPPSQTWRTFLENHVKSMVSVDFLTVPTIRRRAVHALRRAVQSPKIDKCGSLAKTIRDSTGEPVKVTDDANFSRHSHLLRSS